MHYQIFIPGVNTPNPDHLDTAGLTELRSGAAFADCVDGPGGESGQLVTWEMGQDYSPDWDWQPIKQCGYLPAGRFWIGVNQAAPVKPEDLRRPDYLGGAHIELGDGQHWLIPVARQLTTRWTRRESDGAPVKVPLSKFDDYFERAMTVFSRFDSLGRDAIANQQTIIGGEWSLACEALGLNYRLSPALIDHFELLDHWSTLHVVGAAFEVFDLASIVFQKKTDDRLLCRAIEIIWHGDAA